MVEGPKKFFNKKKHSFKHHVTQIESILLWAVIVYIAYKLLMHWWSWMDEEIEKTKEYNMQVDKEKEWVESAYSTLSSNYDQLKDREQYLANHYPKMYKEIQNTSHHKLTPREKHELATLAKHSN
jgi:hypothetical protein